MKGFFANMNFPRWIILISLLASAGLGYRVYQRKNRLKEIHSELARVPDVVRRIQEKGLALQDLTEKASREGLGQGDIETYIREIAASENVNVGQVRTTPRNLERIAGFVDETCKIVPANSKQEYARLNIGNFLYQLEAESRRVKVTQLRISPAERTKEGEVGRDSWKFEATITSRKSKEG